MAYSVQRFSLFVSYKVTKKVKVGSDKSRNSTKEKAIKKLDKEKSGVIYERFNEISQFKNKRRA